MRFLDARLDLHTGCNYRCVYCQNRPQSDKPSTAFPLNKLLQLLPILNKYCWSVFLSCGGEPTLHPQFHEIMRKYVPGLLPKTDVFLVTNGFKLDKDACAAIVESGITRVNISVDTLDSALYSRLCGCAESALAVVLENIDTLLKIRGQKKYPKLFLTSVAMKSTIEKMPDVCAYVAKSGLDGHRIQPMIPYDTVGMQEEDIAGLIDARAVFAQCKTILRKKGIVSDIPLSLGTKIESTLSETSFLKNKVEYLTTSMKKFFVASQKPGCRFAGQLIHIDACGNIEFCKHSETQPGNLFDGSNMELDKRVADTYSGMRKDKMRGCSCECPYLVKKHI